MRKNVINRLAGLGFVLVSLCLSGAAAANTIFLKANPDAVMGSNELVTVGVPVASCTLLNPDNFRVLNNVGQEIPVFVKPTLRWHFKAECPSHIRALKVQFNADMTKGDLVYQFEFTARNTANDLNEQSSSDGVIASTVPGKAGISEPRVVGILTPVYLAGSGLIPPFEPQGSDAYAAYKTYQWENKWRDFNFETSTAANWLFDRTTTIYKYAMATGDVDKYLEAYRSYKFWESKIKRTGNADSTDCKGGFDFGGKACDQKYTYAEPIKLHYALTGDDEDFTTQDINDIASTVWATGNSYAAQVLKSPYTSLNRQTSERGIGLTLLTLVNAYEITGDATILSEIKSGINNIYDAQNTSNPDGFASDGSVRHSWRGHEGDDPYLGRNTAQVSGGSSSLVIADVDNPELLASDSVIRFSGSSSWQNADVSSASDNGDNTWTINLDASLSQDIPADTEIFWSRSSTPETTIIPNDRGFSPWMIENITDAMWHAYQLNLGSSYQTKIEAWFTGAAKAIALYGFQTGSFKSTTKTALESAYSYTYPDFGTGARDWGQNCGPATNPILMYFGSSVASVHQVTGISRNHYATDQHTPETILTVGLGSYFETDSAKQTALRLLVDDLDDWFDTECALIGPYRAFNWQNRSNSWGTYLWVKYGGEAPQTSSKPMPPGAVLFEQTGALDTAPGGGATSGTDTGSTGTNTGSTGTDTGSTGTDTGSTGTDTGSTGTDTGSSEPIPEAPGALDVLSFTNVTNYALDQNILVNNQFDIDWIQSNDDGLWDIYVSSHGGCCSAMYYQDPGKPGTFKYLDVTEGNYYQEGAPRITSSVQFGDLNGDGRWDFWGWDADSGASAKYLNVTPPGQTKPVYAAKSIGCPKNNDFCVSAELTGDGNLEFVSVTSASSDSNTNRRLVTDVLDSSNVIFSALPDGDLTSACYGNDRTHLVSDIDNDSWPDIIVPDGGGYWKNEAGKSLTCKPTIQIDGFKNGGAPRRLAADFDNDGNMDLLLFDIPRAWDPDPDVTVYALKGDGTGNFTQLSSSAVGLDALRNGYNFFYGHIKYADLNNDGYQDLIISGSPNGQTWVSIYMNQGGFQFKKDETLNFDKGRYVDLADYDNDGDLDIVKAWDSGAEPLGIQIWRNDTNNGGRNWLQLRLIGAGNNTDGLHSQVTAYQSGTNNIITNIQTQNTMDENTLRPFLGLSDFSDVDLVVQFPNGGSKCEFTSVPINTKATISSDCKLVRGW